MKEATSGGTGRNYVVVEAHRCAKGTQPPGAVGCSENVSKRWERVQKKTESSLFQSTVLPHRSLNAISVTVNKQNTNRF